MSRTRDSALHLATCAALARTLAEAGSRDEIFAAVAGAANDCIGHKLFTIMAFDPEAMEVQRLFSDNPSAYPPGGRKQKRNTPWGRRVLERGQPYIGRSADDIRANFDDHDVILALGLESVLNMPVRLRGRTIGTMNLLHARDHYDAEDLRAAYVLAGLLAAPLALGTSRLR